MNSSAKSYSWLIKLAWAFEIAAALIGLFVAQSFGLLAFDYQKKELGDTLGLAAYINIILAALPFIMIAFGELLKIPISQIIYEARKISIKIIYSIVLIAITLITFETVYLGLERQYHNVTRMVTLPKQKVEQNKEFIKNLNNRLERINENTPKKIRADYREKVKAEQENFNSQIKNIDEAYKKSQTIDVSIEDIRLKELESDRKKIIKERDNKIKLTDNQISEQQKFKSDNFEKLKDAKDPLIVRGPADDIRDAIKFIDKRLIDLNKERKKIIDNFDARIETNNNQINRIRQIKNKKSFEKSSTDIYKKNRNELTSQRNEKLKILEKEREDLEKEIGLEKKEINNIKKSIFSTEEIIANLKNEIDTAASNNQIYRMAMMFYKGADRPADISKDQADFVAIVWFGSVAFIISTLGAAMAFGYFILSNQEKYNNPNKIPPSRSLNRSARLAFRALRKRWKEPKIVKVTNIIEKEIPKEVIKEIPVEKVVIKEVEKEVPVDKVVLKEVPVEVVSKEIIYTPLWTNDPDRLKFGKTKVENITSEKEEKKDK